MVASRGKQREEDRLMASGLHGRIALVTGAAGAGIGRALAARLAA
jgi:FlaA1/EpsC-like NDP-sugar epimerase